MERLTEFYNGIWILSHKAIKAGYDAYSIHSRLAAYEDTGYTPEEIKSLLSVMEPIKNQRDNAIEMWDKGQKEIVSLKAENERLKKHGEWVKQQSELSETLGICSQCKYPVSWWHKSQYCPNCGANMGLEAGNEQD